MTPNPFNALPGNRPPAAVHATGTCVARRWQQVPAAVLLCHMPGRFFVELTDDPDANEVQYLFPFEAGGEDGRREDYGLFMRLPGALPGTE